MDNTPLNFEHIKSWLASNDESSIPLTPPPDDDQQSRLAPLKRKRAMSLPAIVPASSSRSGSPKRRRPDNDDDVQPEQSASQLGGESVLTLNTKNTFSPPASRVSSIPKRSSSPTRETPIILRNAQPPVLTQCLNGLKEAPPEHVARLGRLLSKGLDFHFIPQSIQDFIKNDPDVGYQATKPDDFYPNDIGLVIELPALWEEVKAIFLNARDCKELGQDENAWCDDVVRPLIHLAMKLYGNGSWRLRNVQSQSINPLYLSTESTRSKYIDRKTDYALSYSHRDPNISDLYERLGAREIGHTTDTFTKRTILFSGFEIKPVSGDRAEAELQMSVWIAASLRKKQELARASQTLIEPTKIVEPALTIVGHDHFVYYAYPHENLVAGRSGVHVLGPDLDNYGLLSTSSIRGIFRLLHFYGNLLKYGKDEGEEGYWGGFLKPVLEKLITSSK